MEIQGHFTRKGLALLSKLSVGTTLTITRVVAGSGRTEDPASAMALPSIRQTLAVNTARQSGNTATIPVTLTAAQASSAYALSELGVYAKDPDEGEILYKLYQLAEPVDITPGSRMVLRFYLEETVSEASTITVACSPAGLITEDEFLPVQDKVMTPRVPTDTVTLEAAELPAYLAGLPRLLTKTLVIKVSGELDAELNINNFYGSGNLKITAVDSGFTAKQPVYISHCKVPVMLENLQMTAPAGLPAESSLCNITNSRYVRLDTCTVTGHEKEAYVYGINASDGSRVICENCSVSGFYAVVLATRTTTIAIYGGSNDYSDNTYGAYVWHGGIIMLYGSVSDTLGGSANLKQGGIIVKADSTLL